MSEAAYTLVLTEQAADDIRRLDKTVVRLIRKKLRQLTEHAANYPHYALKGTMKDYYRVRVGNYRVVYKLDHAKKQVVVTQVGHRKDVYDH